MNPFLKQPISREGDLILLWELLLDNGEYSRAIDWISLGGGERLGSKYFLHQADAPLSVHHVRVAWSSVNG